MEPRFRNQNAKQQRALASDGFTPTEPWNNHLAARVFKPRSPGMKPCRAPHFYRGNRRFTASVPAFQSRWDSNRMMGPDSMDPRPMTTSCRRVAAERVRALPTSRIWVTTRHEAGQGRSSASVDVVVSKPRLTRREAGMGPLRFQNLTYLQHAGLREESPHPLPQQSQPAARPPGIPPHLPRDTLDQRSIVTNVCAPPPEPEVVASQGVANFRWVALCCSLLLQPLP